MTDTGKTDSGKKVFRVIGMMSGTSADGVDAALIDTDGYNHVVPGPEHFRPYTMAERQSIKAAYAAARSMAPGDPWPQPLCEAAQIITDAHCQTVSQLLMQSGIGAQSIDLLGFHGQTVLHDPDRRFTLQIGLPDQLARQARIDVVFDFRTADVTAGGQGAPLVPLYHAARVSHLTLPVAILNLGGVGNVTFVGADNQIIAFDTGPGNALIDDWVHRWTGAGFDRDGVLARAGQVDGTVLAQLLDHPYFNASPPKSLDRDAFAAGPVQRLSLVDGAATLAAFTARSVLAAARYLPDAPHRWLVTGGGRHNPALMAMLSDLLGVPVEPVETVGLRGDAMEAEAFAYLAVRSRLGLPLSVPGTTGVPHPMTGGRFVSVGA